MLKQIAICAALVVLGAGALGARDTDLVVRKMEVPGSGFDILVVANKAQADAASGHVGPAIPLVAGPTGDWLAFATDCEIERIFGPLRTVLHAFRVERKDGGPSSAVNVYVVSKSERLPSHKHSKCDHKPAIF